MKTDQLQQLIKAGKAELLDVRTKKEYRSGHIAGARHLPIDELEQTTRLEAPAEGHTLCLICQSGKRAERARRHLSEKLGIQASVLEHGMNAWEEAGLPVEKETSAGLPLIRQVQIIIGLVNLLTLALGSTVNPLWYAVPALTSCGLLIAGLTGHCGLALVLARMPWNKN